VDLCIIRTGTIGGKPRFSPGLVLEASLFCVQSVPVLHHGTMHHDVLYTARSADPANCQLSYLYLYCHNKQNPRNSYPCFVRNAPPPPPPRFRKSRPIKTELGNGNQVTGPRSPERGSEQIFKWTPCSTAQKNAPHFAIALLCSA
jgi:hypothetical protein